MDDEIFALLQKFHHGVRVLVLSDSCHSGTMIKDVMVLAAYQGAAEPRYRAMPTDVQTRVYFANKKFYDVILSDQTLKDAAEKVRASCLLLSGCQEINSPSMDPSTEPLQGV